jgi:hypothetical protein
MALSRRELLRTAAMGAGALMLPGAGIAARAGTTSGLPSLRPGGPAQVGPFRVLAGSLHDHSTDSDGESAAEAVAQFLAAHRDELGIDYATLSDHSDFFPLSGGVFEKPANDTGIPNGQLPPTVPCDTSGNVPCGSYLPDPNNPTYAAELWARQGGLMATYAGRDFSFLRGFEWTNDQQNHFNVLLSSNWTSRAVTGDASLSMTPFWSWFDAAPQADPTGHGLGFGGGDGVGMFNHPGDKGALNWDDYGLNAAAVGRVALIEIHGDQGRFGRGSSDAGWYWFALAKGWIVSPVMNWDWHEWQSGGVLANSTPGASYGEQGFLPGQRSLILATDSRAGSIRQALLARRTSASETPDLWATLRCGDAWQGSSVSAAPGDALRLTVEAGSGTEPLSHVEIISDNGVDPHSYYYGDNPSWDSPHSQLTPSFVVQHERYIASGGNATRKGRIDAPPPGTVVATADLTSVGPRGQVTVSVDVPTAPSPRPDGRHFFYAVVYAGNPAARCWTGPILTA